MNNSQDHYRSVASAMRAFNAGSDRLRATLAAKLGIGTSEMRAMSFVEEAGRLTPKELSVLMDITTGSMTAMVDRLEAASMLARQPHPTDRRSILLTLTPAGLHATQWADGVFADAIAAVYQYDESRDAAGDAVFLETVGEALKAAALHKQEA